MEFALGLSECLPAPLRDRCTKKKKKKFYKPDFSPPSDARFQAPPLVQALRNLRQISIMVSNIFFFWNQHQSSGCLQTYLPPSCLHVVCYRLVRVLSARLHQEATTTPARRLAVLRERDEKGEITRWPHSSGRESYLPKWLPIPAIFTDLCPGRMTRSQVNHTERKSRNRAGGGGGLAACSQNKTMFVSVLDFL